MEELINDLDKKISKAQNITGNLFDDLRDIRISFNRLKKAINYTRCSTELKENEVMNFDDWVKNNYTFTTQNGYMIKNKGFNLGELHNKYSEYIKSL